MAWNDKYWDIISNLYWTPRYLGLRSIGRNKWRVDGDWVSLPKDLVTNNSGPLYVRARKFGELKTYLEGQEEILNHLFNLVFSVAGDEVLSRLLCRPLEISDTGPFLSLGREIGKRYGFNSVCYGHLGDGNLHVDVMKEQMSDEDWKTKVIEGIGEIFKLTISLGGMLSGEHGIGIAKKPYMPIAMREANLMIMRGIKQTFDPKGILNPGKIF